MGKQGFVLAVLQQVLQGALGRVAAHGLLNAGAERRLELGRWPAPFRNGERNDFIRTDPGYRVFQNAVELHALDLANFGSGGVADPQLGGLARAAVQEKMLAVWRPAHLVKTAARWQLHGARRCIWLGEFAQTDRLNHRSELRAIGRCIYALARQTQNRTGQLGHLPVAA